MSIYRSIFKQPIAKWNYADFFFGVCVFALSFAAALVLQYTVGLTHTPHYYLGHFLFGVGFPFALFAIAQGRLGLCFGLVATTAGHLYNELIADQLTRASYLVDWDHFLAGCLGLVSAWVIYRRWEGFRSSRPH